MTRPASSGPRARTAPVTGRPCRDLPTGPGPHLLLVPGSGRARPLEGLRRSPGVAGRRAQGWSGPNGSVRKEFSLRTMYSPPGTHSPERSTSQAGPPLTEPPAA